MENKRDIGQHSQQPQRLIVLGPPGAGKTTFARELLPLVKLPHYNLDNIYWLAGWSRTPEVNWVARQNRIMATERWLIDGNYLDTAHLRIARAEAAIVLVVRPTVALLRACHRVLKIKGGNSAFLPAAIRRDAELGKRVSATKDFWAMLTKIAWFNRDQLPRLLMMLETRVDLPVYFISCDGRWIPPCMYRLRFRNRIPAIPQCDSENRTQPFFLLARSDAALQIIDHFGASSASKK